MSSTSTSASETSTYTNPTGGWVGNPAGGGGTTQSTLYLFTFLIVLVILGIIAAGLLFRAFFIKRRFRRRIEEAIANGQALPPDALAGLGVVRPAPRKGEKKVGPMPVMWEAEMYRDEIEEDGSRRASLLEKDMTTVNEKPVGEDVEDDWRDLTPVSVIHYPTGEPKTYPPPPPPAPPIPQSMPRRQLLRSLFRPDHYDPIAHIRQAELERMKTREEPSTAQTTFEVPDQGSEVVVGVMIAFPSQDGGSDKWSVSSGGRDEQEVPDVCLGIMEAKIGDKQRR